MIKIQIDNIALRKQEYLDAIKDRIALRVSVLHQSLSHLNGTVVDFDTGHFTSFRPISKHIVEIVGDTITIANGRPGYTHSIADYLINPNNLASINLHGLIQFCESMLANNGLLLSDLLVCNPADLMNHSETILNNNGLNTQININVLKLAFDYSKYNADISIYIRAYFREKKFVKFCPYCNIGSAIHEINAAGEVVESYELDHFYDKATYPIMCYSLFNLVPSDHTCNVTNKGVYKFTDEYQMNPYLAGYIQAIRFVPVGLDTTYGVEYISMSISEVPGSVVYKKINGNNLPDLEVGTLGNLNIFKIRSKYLCKTHRAGTILRTLETNNSYQKHLKKYFQKFRGLDLKDNYVNWYEKELDVPFSPLDFNDKPLSKFHRDIHDHYYELNVSIWNGYINELIAEH